MRYKRMEVFPESLFLPKQATDSDQLYNLGYATFSSPINIRFQSVSDGTWIIGSNETVHICFCSPYNPAPKNALKTRFERELEEEKTELLSNFKLITMGRSEFKSYVEMVREKSGYKKGFAAIYTFSTPQTKGLIWVGEDVDDYSVATVCLESKLGDIGQYIHVNATSGNAIERIKPLLSSFKFSIDSIESTASISNLVENEDIKQQKKNEFNQGMDFTGKPPVD